MPNNELPKRYDFSQEEEIYQLWERSGYFNPDNLPAQAGAGRQAGLSGERTEPFSIILPPPNVTGRLHIGHAAMVSIQDALVRYHRMKGNDTLWLPGTDHAAIATQSKVESQYYERTGKTRHDLGREKFLKKVEAFAQKSHDTIVGQIKRLGASLDWSREAYTLDDDRELAVRTAFKRLYDMGLIYRKNRVVNWDPKLQTTVSDDEVEHKEARGTLYTFRYSQDFPIAISTTRPETKVGDVSVAVHPDDERYQEYVGKEFDVEFVGTALKITVVADEEIDPEFGTGAVGITPAHSMTDYELAQRHDLSLVQVIDENAQMMIDGPLAGKTTKEARTWIVEKLKEQNLMENEEEVTHSVSIAQRGGGTIEPLPKLQWFIAVNKEFELPHSSIDGIPAGSKTTLKKLMYAAVKNGQITIVPGQFEKVYFHWIENLRDWCISRQLWYGHRIPVWYQKSKGQMANGGSKEIYVGIEPPEDEGWEQDPDTLDTWFSAGLWTFSTLGWPLDFAQGKPKEGSDLARFHPTSVMETGYDILFFWVARMVLMSTALLGEIPFQNVYLHGLVRDEEGRKMSKSLDNIIDPLDTTSEFGADATRLSLIMGNAPGQDISLAEDKIKGWRNFTTKLWNIARFVLMNRPDSHPGQSVRRRPILLRRKGFRDSLPTGRQAPQNDRGILQQGDQELIEEAQAIKQEVAQHIENFQLNLAAEKAYEYTRHRFANEIIEESKERLYGENENEKEQAYAMLEAVLLEILTMLHPFMPYVTEVIYQKVKPGELLMIKRWD